MTFSRTEAAMEDAFVEWVNTFDTKVNTIDTVVELADGVVFSKVLIAIDPKWFKQLSSTLEAASMPTFTGDNDENGTWVSRLSNQKKIHRLITRYFDEVLGQDPEQLPSIDLNAIAKEANHYDLLLMCQLIVAIAVQSDNNRVYIDMIQSLSQKSQHSLMLSIEEVMHHFDGDADNIPNRRHSESSSVESRGYLIDSDVPYRYQAEFDRLVSERKHLESSHGQLLLEYEELKERLVSNHLSINKHGLDQNIHIDIYYH
ncbi:hypothetical protein K492DRAFT_138875 [Lichtheimia hyalospora FSU 10163]|nr:hypothetical protein K492DRAFT_138875 [Lichtheimia hyalospora FSU 10163]